MLALFIAAASAFDFKCQACQAAAKIAQEYIDNYGIPLAKKKIKEVIPSWIPADLFVDMVAQYATVGKTCVALKLCKKVSVNRHHNSMPYVLPESNAPTFTTETRPDWSVSWEEQI